jgi:type II secretory pathway component PulJ
MAKPLGLSTIELLISCGLLALSCTIAVGTTSLLQRQQSYITNYAQDRTKLLNRYELFAADSSELLTRNITVKKLQEGIISLEYLQAD